jgi:predicted hydrocarbon binding protein
MQEVHVKAVPVNGLCEFVQQELTPDQLRTAMEKMGADSRWFTGHLLAHEMVPLALVNRFTALCAAEKKEPLRQFAKRAGRYGAALGLKSVYKFILAVLSIEYVLKKAPFMWTRVYDGGSMDVDASDKRARIRIKNFPAHEAGCGRITGWFEVVGERAGAKELRCAHTSCAAEGATECVWDFEWR